MKIRNVLVAVFLGLAAAAPAYSAVSVNIGINIPAYPRLVPVPGYPVYYAPAVNANYFFYDGMYWVFDGDNWYMSSWYNGPWTLVDPYSVPAFVLQVPVRYYHRPPAYFRGWRVDAAPLWGEHWGRSWSDRRHDWNRYDRSQARAAPLPNYQRQYDGRRYPAPDQQANLHQRNYNYQPREAIAQQHYSQQQGPNVRPELTQQQRQEFRQLPREQARQFRNEGRDASGTPIGNGSGG